MQTTVMIHFLRILHPEERVGTRDGAPGALGFSKLNLAVGLLAMTLSFAPSSCSWSVGTLRVYPVIWTRRLKPTVNSA